MYSHLQYPSTSLLGDLGLTIFSVQILLDSQDKNWPENCLRLWASY